MSFKKVSEIVKENRTILIIFFLVLLTLLVSLHNSPLRWWDETIYANLGLHLSQNPLDYSLRHTGWSDYAPDGSWPKIGYRAPMLSYSLAILYFLNLGLLVDLFVPIIACLGILLVYLLGKVMFNKSIAILASLFLSLSPLYLTFSTKILTEVLATFFVLLVFISFWLGYERQDKRFKILFGIFLALAILTRYNIIWVVPVFLIYFIIRDRNIAFIKDKYLWYSIGLFFLMMIPIFVYGIYEYHNPLGSFIHGQSAAAFWGGSNPWYFFIQNLWSIFSVVGILFVISLVHILYKKQFIKREIYLLLLLIFTFVVFSMFMPHKEGRHLLPIFPMICLIASYGLYKINKFRRTLIVLILLGMLFITFSTFISDYKIANTETNSCFLEANKFIENVNNSAVISDEPTVVYYYTHKDTFYYPNPFSIQSLRDKIEGNIKDKKVFILFTDFDMPLTRSENQKIKEELDKNFEIIFNCKDKTFVYEYKIV